MMMNARMNITMMTTMIILDPGQSCYCLLVFAGIIITMMTAMITMMMVIIIIILDPGQSCYCLLVFVNVNVNVG